MSKKKVEILSRERKKQIWQKISQSDWLALVQEFKPDHEWSQAGNEISGLCPYHSEQHPSFRINRDKGLAHCFGCRKTVFDPIRFVADIMGIGRPQAARQLKSRFGIALPSAFTQNVQKIDENDALKVVLLKIMNLELAEALQDPDRPDFKYIQDSGLIPWLQRRQLPMDTLHMWPIGVVMTRERLYNRLGDQPGGEALREPAYEYLKNYLAMPGNPPKCEGWLAFFYYRSPAEIGRIRVRKPDSDTYYAIEDPYDDEVGFFGLNMFPELRGQFDKRPLYTTEGDFDVLSVVAHQLETGKSDVFIVGTGGGMEENVDQLGEYNFKEIYGLQDNDKGGVGWAQGLVGKNKLVTRLFKWDDEADRQIKDVDQAIRAYGFEKFYERLIDEEKGFLRNHEWAVEQATIKLEVIDAGDVEQRNQVAADFGKILQKDAERGTFLDVVCQEFGFTRELILQDMLQDGTPEAFELALQREFEKAYSFVAKAETDKHSVVLDVWHNKNRAMRTFPMDSDNKTKTVVQLDLPPVEDWVGKEVGIPDFVLFKKGPRGKDIPRTSPEIEKLLMHHIMKSLSRASEKAVSKDRLSIVGQGVHYLKENDDSDEFAVYVVNGTKFFKGKLDEETISFQELERPISGNYLFRPENIAWSQNIKQTEDFDDGLQYNPREVFDTVRDIINIGWRFCNHDLETTFLAADMLYTAVPSVFQRMILTDITGESHSGKTTLLQIMGGAAFPGYRICEATTSWDNFSAAFVMRMMSENRLRLILDEFEDNDFGTGKPSPKARAVRQILDLVRSISLGGQWGRATASGQRETGIINFPMTVGGIFTMQDARDLNRFVHIKTRFIKGFTDPIVPIYQKYSRADMRKLRRMVTLCWFKRIPELLKTYEEVKQEFARSNLLPAGMYSRLTDNYLPATAILKFVGEDYRNFMIEFSQLKLRELTEQGGTKQESTDIWQEILNTPVELSRHTELHRGSASIAKIIANRDLEYILNSCELGAYYLPDRQWLIVVWGIITKSVLRWSNRFRNITSHLRLKTVADADPRVIPREKLSRSGFLKDEVWPKTVTKVSFDDISVIDLKDTLHRVDGDIEPITKDEQKRQTMLDDIADELGTGTPKRGDFDL